MMNWRVRSEERMDPTPEQSFSSYTSPATLRSKPAVSAGLPSEGGAIREAGIDCSWSV
jgi:hypothetical protein